MPLPLVSVNTLERKAAAVWCQTGPRATFRPVWEPYALLTRVIGGEHAAHSGHIARDGRGGKIPPTIMLSGGIRLSNCRQFVVCSPADGPSVEDSA